MVWPLSVNKEHILQIVQHRQQLAQLDVDLMSVHPAMVWPLSEQKTNYTKFNSCYDSIEYTIICKIINDASHVVGMFKGEKKSSKNLNPMNSPRYEMINKVS